MEHLLGQDWEIVSAGGVTGEAFFAIKDDEKLFLKRNSSPFLAVLSAEGIVPKLIWTKRMENGDVITAQQCLVGREFKAEEMAGELAPKLLKRIHESKALLKMMIRMEKFPYNPMMMLRDIESIDQDILMIPIVNQSLKFLQQHVKDIRCKQWAVCHGDVNHNNWLLSEDGEVYLIDWDNAMIADPALDLGLLLHWYVPKKDWSQWLAHYGTSLTADLELRMRWYTIAQAILNIHWHKNKQNTKEMEDWLKDLNHFYNDF